MLNVTWWKKRYFYRTIQKNVENSIKYRRPEQPQPD